MTVKWIGQYFKASEFDCSHCGVGGELMDPRLVEVLDECRKQIGVPLQITSGYRCPVHNMALGSTSGSYHLKHQAADITYARRGLRNRVNVLRLFVVLENIGRGFGGLGIGIYPNFIHCDSRTPETNPARWSKMVWPRLK